MIELPTEIRKATQANPKLLILFGKVKSGKTTAVSKLDDCLLIDVEDGGDYVDALIIKADTLRKLYEVKEKIEEKIKEKGKFPYKYIAIDTATKLEEMSLILAKKLYRETPMGKNFEGDDVTQLPHGAGYAYLRNAFKQILNWFTPLCECLILLAHTNEKLINKEGEEMNEMRMDLTGRLERIIAGKSDALGYIYRKKNQTIISFEGGEDMLVEARPAHLKGKKIVIAESDENGKLTTHWDQIFK